MVKYGLSNFSLAFENSFQIICLLTLVNGANLHPLYLLWSHLTYTSYFIAQSKYSLRRISRYWRWSVLGCRRWARSAARRAFGWPWGAGRALARSTRTSRTRRTWATATTSSASPSRGGLGEKIAFSVLLFETNRAQNIFRAPTYRIP